MSSGLCGCFFGSRMLLAGCTGGGCRVSVRDLERVQLSSIAAPDELLFEHEHASGGPAGMRALVQEILNEIRLANWKRKPKAIHMLSSDAHTNFRVSAPFRPKSDGRGQVTSSAKSGLVPLEIVRAKAVESILQCGDWELEQEFGDYTQPSPQGSIPHAVEDVAYTNEKSELLSSRANTHHNDGLTIIKNSLAILREDFVQDITLSR